jgi:tetratricopeptide (TPR) repeat protein
VVQARYLEAISTDPILTEGAYRAAVAHYTELLGENNRETLAVRSLLAQFLKRQNRLEEATAEWRALSDAVTNGAVARDDPLVSQFQGRYGECLKDIGRLEEAEPILIASHDAFIKRDPASRGAKLARERLRDLYTKKGDPDRAAKYAEPTPGG